MAVVAWRSQNYLPRQMHPESTPTMADIGDLGIGIDGYKILIRLSCSAVRKFKAVHAGRLNPQKSSKQYF